MNKVNVKVGERLRWHIEGTLNQTKGGVVVALLKWPFTGSLRAYVVEPDDPAIIASIVPVSSVVGSTARGAQ